MNEIFADSIGRITYNVIWQKLVNRCYAVEIVSRGQKLGVYYRVWIIGSSAKI